MLSLFIFSMCIIHLIKRILKTSEMSVIPPYPTDVGLVLEGALVAEWPAFRLVSQGAYLLCQTDAYTLYIYNTRRFTSIF